MSFRLRYMHYDLELNPGELVIGRGVECQVSLDDPLVSRRHATLVVTEGGVLVRDLSSRNGVLVNGARIQHERRLEDGDVITIGSQQLALVRVRQGSVHASSTSRNQRAQTVTWLGNLRESSPSEPVSSRSPEVSKRLDSLHLLGTLAEKALALGKTEEAERILAAVLADVLRDAARPPAPSMTTLEQAGRYATKLAGATGKGSWVDYVVSLYGAVARPFPATIIDELHVVLRKAQAVDLPAFRAYLSRLRGEAASFGPAERFLVQRIEGLERIASLR